MARIAILCIPELSYNLKTVYGIDIYFIYGILALFIALINAMVLAKGSVKGSLSCSNGFD